MANFLAHLVNSDDFIINGDPVVNSNTVVTAGVLSEELTVAQPVATSAPEIRDAVLVEEPLSASTASNVLTDNSDGALATPQIFEPLNPPFNIIDRYTWDTSYECQDVSGTNWAPADVGVTLTTTVTPTTGVSTAPLTNLPSRMVNQGVSPATDYWQNALFDWQADNFHFRAILDLDNTVVNGDRIFRYVVTGLQLAEIRIISDVNISFTVFNNANGGIFTGTFSGAGLPTGFLLIDWFVNGASMGLFVNGVDYSPADHPSPVPFQNGPDTITVAGFTLAEGTYVFMGWRWDQTISLSNHQADAEILGLFTP